MKKIYLVRHGESAENAGAIIVGDTTPLSEKGQEQAEAIAKRAINLPIEVIISSSLTRAQQTAKAISEQIKKPIVTSDFFRERMMPSNGLGKTVKDPDIIEMEETLVARLADHNHRHSDEENFSDLKVRAQNAFSFLEARPEEHVLVIAHGAFLKILIGEVLFGGELSGKEAVLMMQKMATINTGITIFVFDPEHKYGPWRMLTYNDHAHLG